jgi:hypothetical protein
VREEARRGLEDMKRLLAEQQHAHMRELMQVRSELAGMQQASYASLEQISDRFR